MKHDNEARARVGLPPLEDSDDVIVDDPNKGEGNNNDDNKDDPNKGKNKSTPSATGDGGDEPPKPMSDEELLAELRKRNPSIQSLDDIQKPPTQESEEAKKKKKQKEMLSWGLQSEKIDPEQYSKYQIDSAKKSRQIVYEDFAAKQKAKNKTPEQIDRMFTKLWHEDVEAEGDEDTDTPEILQERQREMDKEARRILKRNYPAMYSLEKEYDTHVSQVQKSETEKQQAREFIKTYRDDLNEITEGFTKETYKNNIGEQNTEAFEEVDFQYSPEVVNQIRTEFLGNGVMIKFIENYDKSVLQDAIRLRLIELTLDDRIESAAKKYFDKRRKKMKAGRNNLAPDEVVASGDDRVIDHEARERVKDYLPG